MRKIVRKIDKGFVTPYYENELLLDCMIRKTKKTALSLPVIIERDEDGFYIGTIPGLKSCYTQAKSITELYRRLPEVVALCVKAERELFHTLPKTNEFLGVQKLEFSV